MFNKSSNFLQKADFRAIEIQETVIQKVLNVIPFDFLVSARGHILLLRYVFLRLYFDPLKIS